MALGHVLGGGSSINAMVWTRGMQRGYDGWAKNGAKGWAFADVLPVFKKQEDWEGGANEWRGSGGPIHIRRPRDPHPTAPAFIEAAREMGMPILDDLNGPVRPGAGYINMNIAADGTRVSAVRAFLRPALSRPNLTLLLNTNVVKLNFKGTRCVGVKLMTDGAVKDIAADKEVILAAGAINSPKLLMLSGVGEAKALRSLGIDVVENLPGVGENLQDHVLLSGAVFKYKGKMPDRPADSNAVEAEAYLSGSDLGDTDISLVLHQLPVVTPEVASRFGTPPPDTFTIAPALVQPTSKGSVRLARAERKRAEALLDGEKRLLEMVASGRPLENVLEAMCRLVETIVGNSACSILLIDSTGTFRHAAGPTLPPGYDATVNGAPAVCEGGPCGTAASLKVEGTGDRLRSWFGLAVARTRVADSRVGARPPVGVLHTDCLFD
jgi:choline dehydrogenase